jgi:predicted DNA-binding protein (UPF0278 family)
MAQQDYLSKAGGQFGTLAGSILSDRRSRKKKDAYTALAISAFIETLGAKNKQLDQDLEDSIKDVNENFTIGNLSRQYQWEEEKEARGLYNDYLDNPETTINNYAIQLYDEDPNIIGMDVNFRTRGKLTGDAKVIEEELWQSKKQKAKEYLEALANNPLTAKPTFQTFNQVYYNEHKSAIRRLKDDPSKQGAIRSWINKKFPEKYDARIAELDVALEEQRKKVAQQEQRPVKVKEEKVYTKEEAIDRVQEVYQDKLSDDTMLEIEGIINNRNADLGFTENEILSAAISTQILNESYLGPVEAEIKKATSVFNAGYARSKRTEGGILGDIPKPNDDTYQAYSDELSDYLDINVFKRDPITAKTNKLLRIIGDPNSTKAAIEIATANLREMGKDSTFNSIITYTLGGWADPVRRINIQSDIDAEKRDPNPRFTDQAEWVTWTISQQKALLDSVYEEFAPIPQPTP